MHTMKLTAKKNDGVSPVIGTILLVAITVVLVAIISAVVMGMAGDVGNAHVVGVKVTQNNSVASELLLTFTGGDVASVKGIAIYSGSNMFNNSKFTPAVGVPMVIKMTTGGVALPTGANSISVIGIFSDGNQTIWSGNLNMV